ncbi:hypothetical protein Ciccas_004825 [Cichlidogyrus casuarinus]|uniref:Uncharacterized protein n=1 Tax=Cichlidogyrus casuarinus TaxID=1844966 RepID=A0ABD2QAL4_9PLAT
MANGCATFGTEAFVDFFEAISDPLKAIQWTQKEESMVLLCYLFPLLTVDRVRELTRETMSSGLNCTQECDGIVEKLMNFKNATAEHKSKVYMALLERLVQMLFNRPFSMHDKSRLLTTSFTWSTSVHTSTGLEKLIKYYSSQGEVPNDGLSTENEEEENISEDWSEYAYLTDIDDDGEEEEDGEDE